MNTREPAVAGMFYTEHPVQLRNDIENLLHQVSPPPLTPKTLIVPHAGYIYSGEAAAHAYSLLIPLAPQIRRVVLLGPSHRVPLRGLALPGCDQFRTPLGTIPIDKELAQKAVHLPQVHTLEIAHQWEHSLEVQLPFLQTVLGELTLLPLVVGDAPIDHVAEVLETLWGNEETLVVISTDLSHFHPYAEATRIDRLTSNKIEQLHCDFKGEQACGCHALNGLMRLAADKKLRITTLALMNSGDTAGDRSRVVGYGAYALYP